eukprot:TRINITY_DN5074_c0_g1_i2.p1 TRINITY_DN5074_c0_g1~~TRINITY_DN5074_c0_g1_i2.p1  ORF type:complete len:343 (+),score=57.02 TRINITY_DN5074_c0_g1_i2:59-1030(+)
MAGEASWCSGENKRKAHLKRMVDPRNLNWANDKDAFGKKMMEKMGWNQGEGLGASGNGEITSIKVVHKMDRVGINEGETIDRSNAWQENQSAFSDILANLAAANASGNNSNGSDDGGAEKKRKRKKKSDDTTSNGSSTKKKRKRTTDKPVRRIGAAQILHAKAKRQRVGKHAVKSKEDLQHILGLPTGPSKDSKAGLSDPVGNGAEGKAKEEVVVDKTDVKVTVSSLSVTDYFKQKGEDRCCGRCCCSYLVLLLLCCCCNCCCYHLAVSTSSCAYFLSCRNLFTLVFVVFGRRSVGEAASDRLRQAWRQCCCRGPGSDTETFL